MKVNGFRMGARRRTYGTENGDGRLAIDGGAPVRETPLSFAPPDIREEDIAEVVDTLRSGWLVTGPKVQRFEREFAAYLGVPLEGPFKAEQYRY